MEAKKIAIKTANFVVGKIVRSMLWVDRNVWKAYCGIETPLYKIWWDSHSAAMQRKLNAHYAGLV